MFNQIYIYIYIYIMFNQLINIYIYIYIQNTVQWLEVILLNTNNIISVICLHSVK